MADLNTSDQGSPEPRFTNVARVRHTDTEFYVEHAQLDLDRPGMANLVSYLVMTPQHIKEFLQVLSDNVDRYETKHGTIQPAPATKKDTIQ